MTTRLGWFPAKKEVWNEGNYKQWAISIQMVIIDNRKTNKVEKVHLPQYPSGHFNYEARGTFGPSTLNYLLNGVANA